MHFVTKYVTEIEMRVWRDSVVDETRWTAFCSVFKVVNERRCLFSVLLFCWHPVNSWFIHTVNVRRWVGSFTLGGDSLSLFERLFFEKGPGGRKTRAAARTATAGR